MKRRKLKNFVLPTIYVLIIVASFFSISILNNLLLNDEIDYDYSKSLMKDATEATLKETEEAHIYKPYVSENVEVFVSYYNKDDEDIKKEQSLILYQNTYMPSTGVIYSSSEDFDVIAAMDGKVTNISEDDILGTTIEVTHNTNLTTYYYSLKDVPVNVGTEVQAGTIIGRATTNKIKDDSNNFLFEVYYQGKSIDPEKFYTMSVNELQ